MNKVLVSVLVAGVSSVMVLSGCYVHARPYHATATVDYSYGGWTPYYYNGSLVYFDGMARPYYYSGGRIVYVPSTWAYYHTSVRAYRTRGHQYRAWHGRYHRPNYYSRPVRVHHRPGARTHRGAYHRPGARPAPARRAPVRSAPARRTRYR